MKIIAIESLKDLPNQPCATYPYKKPDDIIKNYKIIFGKEPEVVYSHKTGVYIPLTVDEYQMCRSVVVTRVPEEI